MVLHELLGLPEREKHVVSLCGGGGKTTLMYALARETKAIMPTALFTTTHIMTRLTNDLNDMGYAYFDWNVSAADTASDATRYTVIENFKESVPKHDYSVVLQHDTNAFSVDAVEEILSWGIKNGYSFRALDLTSPAVHHSVAN